MSVVIPSEALLLGGAEASQRWLDAYAGEVMADSCWFCYMVKCRDRSLYVGVATDVGKRVQQRNWGVGAKFTSKRRPVVLIWWQEFPNQKAARSRERELKGWRREK